MFRGGFRVPNMRWQVQKLVFGTAADMIDQKNQLKQVTQCKKCEKTTVEVEKKVTTFWEKIRPGQCQPYALLVSPYNLTKVVTATATIMERTAGGTRSVADPMWQPASTPASASRRGSSRRIFLQTLQTNDVHCRLHL